MKKASLLCIQCLEREEKQYHDYIRSLLKGQCTKDPTESEVPVFKASRYPNELRSQPLHREATTSYCVARKIFSQRIECSMTFLVSVKEIVLCNENWMRSIFFLIQAHSWCFCCTAQFWFFSRTCQNLQMMEWEGHSLWAICHSSQMTALQTHFFSAIAISIKQSKTATLSHEISIKVPTNTGHCYVWLRLQSTFFSFSCFFSSSSLSELLFRCFFFFFFFFFFSSFSFSWCIWERRLKYSAIRVGTKPHHKF